MWMGRRGAKKEPSGLVHGVLGLGTPPSPMLFCLSSLARLAAAAVVVGRHGRCRLGVCVSGTEGSLRLGLGLGRTSGKGGGRVV